MTDRFVELETRIAFFEDTLEHLNHVVTRQSQQIDTLEIQNKAIMQRLRDLSDLSKPEVLDEAPPHY